jgi:hypothetical protein
MHRRKAVESTQALEETKAELDRLKQQADKVCGARHLNISPSPAVGSLLATIVMARRAHSEKARART